MRYKFNLTREIKSAVEWQVRDYREYKRQIEEYWREALPSPVQKYSQTGGSGGASANRSTEETVIQIKSTYYMRHLETTCEAIERALSYMDEIDMRLIDYIYWKKWLNPTGAGEKIGLSKSAVYERLNKILGILAYELGYVQMI